MSERVPIAMRQAAFERAAFRCEYCYFPEVFSHYSHEADHIIPIRHTGSTTLENIACACLECNRAKSDNIASLDKNQQIVQLFNPRIDKWHEHFVWQGAKVIDLTAVGEATIRILGINEPERILERQLFIELGLYFNS